MARISFTILFSILIKIASYGQTDTTQTMSLLFIGDIMGHGPQIKSAYDDSLGSYNYDPVFKHIKPVIEDADYAIANLEVTLAGKPFTGYPQFSSPDELALACRKSGIDVLMTANNHSCDRSKQGIVRTIQILDSFNICHTGTFENEMAREVNNLLVLEKGGIRVGILNYTYGTNGIPAPSPTIVNLIDKGQIAEDIKESKPWELDKLIVFLHWGEEYQSHPNGFQTGFAEFLFSQGVDIIIASHPHVLQKMAWKQKNDTINGQFTAYSLGNFVSNQRKRKTDGGAMVKINLAKTDSSTSISEAGYYLTWVYKYSSDTETYYHILPCSKFEDQPQFFKSAEAFETMKTFINDSRILFEAGNLNVNERQVYY